MSVRQCVSLLALASLLFLQLTAAEFDQATCAENCRFVVVPSLGPAGPRGLNGTKGEKGDKGDAATLDTSQTYLDVKFKNADLSVSKVWDSRITGGYTTNSEFWDGYTYNVVMRMKTEIGFPSDITPEALHPETKIYHPFITHGVLSGATKIEGGATLDRPVIDSPQITGVWTIGEGATILRPNITAPIIDGAAVIGEGSIIVRPNITAPVIDGATIIREGSIVVRPNITAPKISDSQMTGATTIGVGAVLTAPTALNTIIVSTPATPTVGTTITPTAVTPGLSNSNPISNEVNARTYNAANFEFPPPAVATSKPGLVVCEEVTMRVRMYGFFNQTVQSEITWLTMRLFRVGWFVAMRMETLTPTVSNTAASSTGLPITTHPSTSIPPRMRPTRSITVPLSVHNNGWEKGLATITTAGQVIIFRGTDPENTVGFTSGHMSFPAFNAEWSTNAS